MAKVQYAMMVLVLGALMFGSGYQYGQMEPITWATCYETLIGK